MINTLPPFPGASGAYHRAYRILAAMAQAGHVQVVRSGRQTRCHVSDEMREFISVLDRGNEEVVKGLNLLYSRFMEVRP